MDANRFDTLAKALTGTQSRRSALGAAIAGGVLSAFGFGREAPVHAGQADRCELPGSGGTCVLDFEATVREGPSARQPLVSGGSPGRLRGYLIFTQGRTGSLDDATLLLDDGSRLPVAGLAIGQGFQARIDLGQGRALVAVGVGDQDLNRCLGRLDGTVTGTEIGDLGEWHAIAGVQNIPDAAGRAQAAGSGNGPVSNGSGAGSQPATGNSTTGGGGNQPDIGDGNRPVAETTGNQSGGNANGGGSEPNAVSGGNAGNGDTAPENSGSGRPANDSSSNRPNTDIDDDDRASVEARQEADDAEPVLACPEGQTRCSNVCVNTTSDVFNCGDCGRICELDEECTGGQCLAIDAVADGDANADATEQECEAGQTRCGETCTDVQIDEANCGACKTTCAAGEECVAGVCTPPAPVLCPEGQVRCDGICREALPNFGSEGISCPGGGGVPTECPAGRVLCNGACFPEGSCQPAECQPGWGYCYGVCRDFQNDPGYCGGCSMPCPGGVCQNGRCFLCPEGHLPCGGACVNVQEDLNNCGFCGVLCGTQCINGQCTAVGPSPTCAPGTTRCGNACVDLTRDSANCGACGKVCGPDTVCYAPGECGFSEEYCDSLGKQACGLGCVPRSDPFNCGGCGFVCPGGYACDSKLEICYIIGGSVRDGVKPTPPRTLAPADQQTLVPTENVTCGPGLEACGGDCADLSADPLHCGACGNTCGEGATCQQGQCATPDATSGEQTLAPGDDESSTEPAASEAEAEPSSPSCPEGQRDCGGVCADVASDPANCGDCGVVCGLDSSCDAGVCSTPPTVPEETEPPEVTEPEATAPEAAAPEAAAPEDTGATCADAGGPCDLASPGACCSGVCNDDGTCA